MKFKIEYPGEERRGVDSKIFFFIEVPWHKLKNSTRDRMWDTSVLYHFFKNEMQSSADFF